jgi:hypothetical protein
VLGGAVGEVSDRWVSPLTVRSYYHRLYITLS